MLKLKKNRKFTYDWKIEEGDISFSVTFEHPYAEDEDYGLLKDELKDIPKDITPEERDILIADISSTIGTNMYMSRYRKALVSWTDICDEETGEPFEFNEVNQKAIFEFVQSIPELFLKITNDKTGSMVTTKN